MYFTSCVSVFFQQLNTTTWLGIGIGLLVVFVVLFLATLDIRLSLIGFLNVTLVTVFVVGISPVIGCDIEVCKHIKTS